jgi:D-lactate dehydrogenase
MKVFVYDTHSYDRERFCKENENFNHNLNFYEGKLNEKSAALASGFDCVCPFVNDKLNQEVLSTLASNGTRLIALRSAGYNHVDLAAAKNLGLKVVRVPEYSPYSVAEHAMALILTLNRKIHKAFNRVREGNFSLEGLVGFDLHGKTVGVIGTGKIGTAFIKIARGFGCQVIAYDLYPNEKLAKELDFKYVPLEEIFERSDIISLHVPLSKETKHLINSKALEKMKSGVMLINTSRGGLIDTKALINGLKSGEIGSAGLDVYEEEEQFFFQDLSGHVLSDDVLIRLMTFPNVVLTSHQGFLTNEALGNIAETTLQNISDFQNGRELKNEVSIA